METILKVRNLNIDIPLGSSALHAVRSLSFDLKRGETLCLVGESGSGKSITVKGLMGLLPSFMQIACDEAVVAGADLRTKSRRLMRGIRGKRLAMIFQEPMTSLHPTTTIGKQLLEAYNQHETGGTKGGTARAIELLEKVGITAPEQRLKQYPHELSGGMQQRIMIAMALMCKPDVLIADEPTTALDVTIQAQILHLLKDLQLSLGLAIVFITHDLGVVARIADHVAVMYAGQIVERGTVKEIFSFPRHPYTLGLLKSIPVPGKTRRGDPLFSIPGVVPTLVDGFRGCAFRNRCFSADQQCTQDPPDVRFEGGHTGLCWHPNKTDETAQASVLS